MNHTMDVHIYYEDTDCGGVVYYANYLKYFERARTQYLEERGLSVAGLMKEGRVFVVVHAEVDYLAPARYGETLQIQTVIAEMPPSIRRISVEVTRSLSSDGGPVLAANPV